MAEPLIPQRAPYVLDVQPGNYAWCSCGRSKSQPYCDGAHKGTEFRPIKLDIAEATRAAWCGCKHSANKPWCDGTHKRLPC